MIEINFTVLLKNERDNFYKDKKCLDISEKTNKKSFFNPTDEYVFIETLTTRRSYQLKKVFYVLLDNKPYLFVHITNKRNNRIRESTPKFLMTIKIGYKKIENCETTPIFFNDKDEIPVFVFNDNIPDLYCDKVKIMLQDLIKFQNNKGILEPKEAGGGVIVKFP